MKYDGIFCNKFTKRYAIWNGISRLDNPLHILLRRQKLFQGMIVNANKDDNLGKKVLTSKKERKKKQTHHLNRIIPRNLAPNIHN